jgi:hypothetical protein
MSQSGPEHKALLNHHRSLIDHYGLCEFERGRHPDSHSTYQDCCKTRRDVEDSFKVLLERAESAESQRDDLVRTLVGLFDWTDTSYLHAVLHVENAVYDLVTNSKLLEMENTHLNRLLATGAEYDGSWTCTQCSNVRGFDTPRCVGHMDDDNGFYIMHKPVNAPWFNTISAQAVSNLDPMDVVVYADWLEEDDQEDAATADSEEIRDELITVREGLSRRLYNWLEASRRTRARLDKLIRDLDG